MTQVDRSSVLNGLEQKEVALVRALLQNPALIDPAAEAGVRTAISLSRLHQIRHEGEEVDVEPAILRLREETLRLLDVAMPDGEPVADKIRPVATILREHAVRGLESLLKHCQGRLPREVVEREVREKRLVLALGGGGGVAFSYLGVFKLLEECGIRPALIAATSMGASMGGLRARAERYDHAEMVGIGRSLSWPKLFQLLSMESRYGLPAALRLYLRATFAKYFEHPDGSPVTLAELPIPFIATVSGIRAGVLPRPLDYYEKLLDGILASPSAFRMASRIPQIIGATLELVQISERLDSIYLGREPGTEAFDVLDAVGFSCSLPGVIHYDVVRDDPRMKKLLDELFARRELFRLADGGLVDNVPARAAWNAVQDGRIGTRNAFVLACDGFAPRLSAPVWLPIQQIIQAQVARSCRFAHLYKPMKNTLSPLDVVPNLPALIKVIDRGHAQLAADLPFIRKMLGPLPPLQ